MATNEVFEHGDRLSLPVPNSTASGAPLRLGGTAAAALNVVTQTKTGAAGEPDGGNATGYASCALSGVHKLAIGTTTAMAVLDPVYITSGNALTPSASGNQLFGHILEAKGTTAGEVHRVRIAN
jgi:hypothetical protein